MNERIETGFFIVGFVFVIGLIAHFKKIQLPLGASAALKKLFIFMCALLTITFILSIFGIYFRGYWTTKIIIWTFILVGSLLYSFGNSQVVTKTWKRITAIIFYFPVSSILLIIVPTFLGTILSLALWLRLTGDPKAIYYNDNEVRIQKLCSKCDAGFRGDPEYFEKKGMFEFDQGYLRTANNTFNDILRVAKTKDSIVVYLYYTNQDPILFKFKR